jgi:serine phosphatase RsbU (regulator of sigma subunit)
MAERRGRFLNWFFGNAHARWSDPAQHPLLLWGVFFTFFPMGLIGMMIPDNPGSWRGIFTIALFSGGIAVGWASAFVLSRRWILLIVIPLQILIPWQGFIALARLGWFSGSTGLTPTWTRVALMGLAVASTVVGYILAMRVARRLESVSVRSRAELEIASTIHRSLVPDLDLSTPRLRITGTSRPSSEMGGDLIDASIHADRVDVILGDVSGHGVGAGIVMGMLKSASRTLQQAEPSVGQLLKRVNSVLAELTRPETFATLAIIRLAPSGEFEYGLAGHLPILHRRGATGEIVEYANESLPLGIDDSESFPVGSGMLEPGDTLLLVTDGLIEVRNASGAEFGLGAIRRLFAEHGGEWPEVLRDRILTSAANHGLAMDDQSLVIVRAVG